MKKYSLLFLLFLSIFSFAENKMHCKKKTKKQTITVDSTKAEDIKKPYSGMTVSLQKTIIVKEEKAACEGNPGAKCLQIKKPEQKEFEIFYQDIEGFVFEEGYRQTILVNERHIPNPMIKEADAIYTLIKVISKEKIKQ